MTVDRQVVHLTLEELGLGAHAPKGRHGTVQGRGTHAEGEEKSCEWMLAHNVCADARWPTRGSVPVERQRDGARPGHGVIQGHLPLAEKRALQRPDAATTTLGFEDRED